MKAETDQLVGNDIPPEERLRLIGICEDRARAKLKSPSSARFPEEPSVSGTDNGGALIIGKFEAQNGYSGYGQLTFICTVERFGKRLVPGEVTVY